MFYLATSLIPGAGLIGAGLFSGREGMVIVGAVIVGSGWILGYAVVMVVALIGLIVSDTRAPANETAEERLRRRWGEAGHEADACRRKWTTGWAEHLNRAGNGNGPNEPCTSFARLEPGFGGAGVRVPGNSGETRSTGNTGTAGTGSGPSSRADITRWRCIDGSVRSMG